MPVPALQALATSAGVSTQRAEHLWDMAKEQAKDAGHTEDYAYIMGIVKRAMKLEGLIGAVVAGVRPDLVLHRLMEGRQVGVAYEQEQPVRTFFDEMGRLRFATLERVLIDPATDPRLEHLSLASERTNDRKLVDLLATFVGPLQDIYERVMSQLQEAGDTGPARTYLRPRKRRFGGRGPGFSPTTGKRKDPRKRLIARRTARRFGARRKAASKRFNMSSRGKQFHRKLGKLVAKIRR